MTGCKFTIFPYVDQDVLLTGGLHALVAIDVDLFDPRLRVIDDFEKTRRMFHRVKFTSMAAEGRIVYDVSQGGKTVKPSMRRFGSAILLSVALTSSLLIAQSPDPEAQQKLKELEQQAPATGIERFYALSRLAKAAFNAGEMQKAELYAKELLAMAPNYPKDWNYGNAIFFGNMVIGRVALKRDNNRALAKSSLMASGHTPGSPQLDSFGPNMSLAKDLLAVGETDEVLKFFELCRVFWKQHLATLDEWAAVIKRGGTPNFGPNLVY